MNVLWISGDINAIKRFKATDYRSMLWHMPVRLFEAYSVEAVRKYAPKMDVIIFQCWKAVPFRDELNFLNHCEAYMVGCNCDIWSRSWAGKNVRVDTLFSVYRDIPATKDFIEKVFWCAPSLDVQHYDLERHQDVIFWGAWHDKAYAFRNYVFAALKERTDEGALEKDTSSYTVPLRLGGNEYTYRVLAGRGARTYYRFFGPHLYRELCSSKIAPAGPVVKRGEPGAVGKYIENAACGAVMLTPQFAELDSLGFVHGQNIYYTDEDNFLMDLTYLLEHPSHVEHMRENSMELVRQRHTKAARAQEVYEFLRAETGIE